MNLDEMSALVPPAVRQACEVLKSAGYEAWTVGGAVRDLCLDKVPSDWDVTTDALPEQVLELFEKTIPTGLQHGTVTAIIGRGKEREQVEITTFRGEGAYSDSRRPDSVHFGVPLDEDLKRRDFVINAMAFDPIDKRLHDPFGGRADITVRKIRAVGVAEERFREDGLRVMRAVRFVSVLGFDLEPSTEAGAAAALDSLSKVAQERIRVELFKLLSGQAVRRALDLARRNHILELILPEMGREDWERCMDEIEALPPEPSMRLAVLLSGCDEELADAALRRLTTSNEDRKRILAVLRHLDGLEGCALEDSALRRHLSAVGKRHLEDHLIVQGAMARARKDASWEDKVARCHELIDGGHPLDNSDLALDGRELMAATGAKGRAIGDTLDHLLGLVLDDPEKNVKELLVEEARRFVEAGQVEPS